MFFRSEKGTIKIFFLLTFVFITFAFDTEYGDDHDYDDYRCGCQSDHKPGLSIKWYVLEISVF